MNKQLTLDIESQIFFKGITYLNTQYKQPMNNQSDCNPCITAKVTYRVRQIVIEHTNVPQQVCCVCQKFLEAAESFARQYNIF